MYVFVQDGTVVQINDELPGVFGNMTGFNLLTDEEAAEHGWLPFIPVDPPEYDKLTQELGEPAYVINPTNVTQAWTVQTLVTAVANQALAATIEATCNQVDIVRNALVSGGFNFNGKNYQSDQDSQLNIAGAAQAAALAVSAGAQPGNLRWANPDSDFVWIAEDNSAIPMDAQTMIAFFQTGVAYKSALIFYGASLKTQVRAMTTSTQFAAFDVNVGWPGS